MSYSAFYSFAVAIRRELRALDNARLAKTQGTGDANAEEALKCQRGGSGVSHEQAGAGAKGEPTTSPERVWRGHLSGFFGPFEF
jgi:hypothetical protein